MRLISRLLCTAKEATLTSVRYPQIHRGKYSKLEDKHVAFFEKLLGKNGLILGEKETVGYNTDWLGIYKGASECVLRPKQVEQISEILKYCYQNDLALCTQGGNTGLVGGSTPVHDEIILSLAGLNSIIEFDPISGILTCEAGCILETLDHHVNEFGYMMPLDLGAKGSCHIGGNIATAAGGMRLIRYGSLHAHVLGLEVVLPSSSGTVLNCISHLRKDNTGLHLPHLFVGSEGQLGIITKVAMTVVAKPTSVNVALLSLDSFESCLRVLSLAKKHLSEILSSFEWMDKGTVKCVEDNLHLKNVLEKQGNENFYIFIETAGSNSEHDTEKLHKFLEICMEEKDILNGTVAADYDQATYIFSIRERAAEALVHDGYTYKQDFSIPLPYFYEIVEDTRKRVGHLAKRVVAYGHLGDSNIHLNITTEKFDKEVADLLYPWLYEWVSSKGGSISAEHGIGFSKRNYANYSQNTEALQLMAQLKQVFDPKLILNPYKTIPGWEKG